MIATKEELERIALIKDGICGSENLFTDEELLKFAKKELEEVKKHNAKFGQPNPPKPIW